jgi:hypothetical protein
MHLPGRLGQTTLGDLLGLLHREHATGILEFVEDHGVVAGRTHEIHLIDGWPVGVETSLRVEKLGQILVRRHGVRLADVTRHALGGRSPLGRRLVEARLIDEPHLREALDHQFVLRVDALFGLTDARVAFRLMPSCPKVRESHSPLPLQQFLWGRPRYRDGHPTERRPQRASVEPLRNEQRDRDLRVLGLGPEAEPSSIRGAFRRLAASLHPDRCLSASAEERQRRQRRFVELGAAYHRLAG